MNVNQTTNCVASYTSSQLDAILEFDMARLRIRYIWPPSRQKSHHSDYKTAVSIQKFAEPGLDLLNFKMTVPDRDSWAWCRHASNTLLGQNYWNTTHPAFLRALQASSGKLFR